MQCHAFVNVMQCNATQCNAAVRGYALLCVGGREGKRQREGKSQRKGKRQSGREKERAGAMERGREGQMERGGEVERERERKRGADKDGERKRGRGRGGEEEGSGQGQGEGKGDRGRGRGAVQLLALTVQRRDHRLTRRSGLRPIWCKDLRWVVDDRCQGSLGIDLVSGQMLCCQVSSSRTLGIIYSNSFMNM